MLPLGPWGFGALLVILAINTLFVAGVAIAVWQIQRRVAAIERRLEPQLERATGVLARTERLLQEIHHHTERILASAARVVDTVAERVDTTTALAERAVSEPLIGVASVVAGIGRAVRTYREEVEQGDSRR